MGGSGGTRTETSPRDPDINPQLRPLIDRAVAGSLGAMDNIDLSEFTGSNVQDIPGLTPDEQQWMQAIFKWAGDPSWLEPANQGMDYTRQASEASPYETQGGDYARRGGSASEYETQGADYTRRASESDPFEQLGGLRLEGGGQLSKGEQDAMDRLGVLMRGGSRGSVGARGAAATRAGVNTDTRQMLRAEQLAQQLTAGDVGQSPATLQAMQAWEDLVRPTVMAGQAVTGNLGGGATEEALAHGKTEALTPLLSKEIDTREQMAQMLGQLGLGASAQELQASQTNAELGTRVSEGNANRELQAQEDNLRAGLEAAGMDASAAAQLAAISSGAKQRELASGAALGQLGGQRQGRRLQAGGQLAQIGGAQRGRELTAGGLLSQIGGQQQTRRLQAGGQLAAIGTEKANLEISRLAKALETAGMPREIATKQAQARYNDFLRRQSLAEGLYEAPTGQFLAGELTPGQLVESRQTGGGMFGS
jgi:hypothetical protein